MNQYQRSNAYAMFRWMRAISASFLCHVRSHIPMCAALGCGRYWYSGVSLPIAAAAAAHIWRNISSPNALSSFANAWNYIYVIRERAIRADAPDTPNKALSPARARSTTPQHTTTAGVDSPAIIFKRGKSYSLLWHIASCIRWLHRLFRPKILREQEGQRISLMPMGIMTPHMSYTYSWCT